MRMVALAFVSLISLPAVAQTASADRSSPRGAVYVVVGAGTPVGFFGLEGLGRILPQLEITAGIGLGSSAMDSGDLQWAVMPRYRLGSGRTVLTVGLGLSGGNYSHTYLSLCGSEEELLACNTPESWRYTLWSNLEIGGEYWATSRFAVRYFAGYGHILAQGAPQCDASSGCADTSNMPYANIPYFGLALGTWF
jgi:hypothetical protein